MPETQPPRWTDIRKNLELLEKPAIITLLKDLHGLSVENRRFFEARFAQDSSQAESILDDSKERIENLFFGKGDFPTSEPKLREARKLISNYKKATSDIVRTLDLMLWYVETGTKLTSLYGDFDEPFYNSLESVLNEFMESLLKTPEPRHVFAQFAERLSELAGVAAEIGWGYGDYVQQTLDDLEKRFSG